MSSLAKILPWDTEFFGMRIARLVTPALSQEDALALERWARAERVACVYVLIDAGDLDTTRMMAVLGASLLDVRVTLATDGRGPTEVSPSVAAAREANEADLPALEEVAASAHRYSRFYADPRFDRGRVDDLYRVWIRNAVRGGTGVVTFDEANRAAGYVTYAIGRGESPDVGEIGLVGVAERARGRGMGTALLNGAMSRLSQGGASRVRVVTQGRNVVAQRMYQKSHFRTERVELWFHIWFDDASPGG